MPLVLILPLVAVTAACRSGPAGSSEVSARQRELARRLGLSPDDPRLRRALEASDGDDGEEDEEGPATLVGRILDSEGRPLERGRVIVLDHQDPDRAQRLATAEVQGPEGEFRCVLQAPAEAHVFVDPDSLPDGLVTVPDHSPLSDALRKGNGKVPVAEAAGGYAHLEAGGTFHVDLTVGRPGRVTGRLVDRDGRPIAEALADLQATNDSRLGSYGERAMTDASGAFIFDPVFPGSLRLTFSYAAPDRYPFPVDFHLRAEEDLDLGTIRIPPGDGKSLRGVILNQRGDPFAGLPILVYLAGPPPDGAAPYDWGARVALTRTAADGSFAFDDLPAVPVKVLFTFSPPRNGRRYAHWAPSVAVDWNGAQDEIDLGVHVVQERFTSEGDR